MKIEIQINEKNKVYNEKLLDDYYLNELINFYIQSPDRTYLNMFLRSVFYLNSPEEYYETYLDYSVAFSFKSDEFLFIYNLFNQWAPYKNIL